MYANFLEPGSRCVQATVLTKAIRFCIPKRPLQSQAGENLAHLVRVVDAGNSPAIGLNTKLSPASKVVYRYERPNRITMHRTPIPNQFFRPEEEHVASGEYDVVPPLRSWDKAVENPGRRFRFLEAHCKTKWISGLLVPGVNHTRSV